MKIAYSARGSTDELGNATVTITRDKIGGRLTAAETLVIRSPSLNDDAAENYEGLSQERISYNVMDVCAIALERKRLPQPSVVQVQQI